MRVAILQRDPVQSRAIEKIFNEAGHTCVIYQDGLILSKSLALSTADLLVLDWQGLRLSGGEVLRSARWVGAEQIPVIFASFDDSEEAIVRAFAYGADDYVQLPIRPAEFRARVTALLRRAYPDRQGAVRSDVGPYHFDARHQVVTLRGAPVRLSGTQYRLASLFFSNIGRVLTRDHIFAMVWGREFRESTRTIDSHVSRLRLLLEIEARNGLRLQPVYRSGYRLLSLRTVESDKHKAA
ncbi:response regulator transcription factor [Paraburkholderia sp. BL10I2N1]|uniref:response regulator transcription factor n=1 Tax=Paraburkholderia sp. BL10I2N1 TaxID=1938796 RepID=UPI00105C522F|nr:response regulator transcription factor [Paraburkholderia sp. BL10I2N1]TDN63742.1 winged helix family two component transcriptional regulator [Paraburkholderia sp. BL10I2N1]